jgi:cystathionine beta-synthase
MKPLALKYGGKQTERSHTLFAHGTGGTITGTAMYLKEKILTYKFGPLMYMVRCLQNISTGRVDNNEVHPYISEGFGELCSKNYDMSVIDHFEQVTDKAGA